MSAAGSARPTSGSPSGYVCPTCKRAVTATSLWRPFCTERCKMADLGGWFLGKYRIAGSDVEAEEDGATGAPTIDDTD